MITIPIEISWVRKIARDALVDTGFTGGIFLSKSAARAAGATLCEPPRMPRGPDGKRIDGQATVLRVRIPGADVETETLAFCPDAPTREILIGAFLLGRVGAALLIGTARYKFPRPSRGNPACSGLDVGDWVIPRRPVEPWW
ncbi:MAG: hypothetical protein WC683_02980 [bacterium]